MKLFSPSHMLLAGGLTIGLIACAAGRADKFARTEIVAAGPLGPSPQASSSAGAKTDPAVAPPPPPNSNVMVNAPNNSFSGGVPDKLDQAAEGEGAAKNVTLGDPLFSFLGSETATAEVTKPPKPIVARGTSKSREVAKPPSPQPPGGAAEGANAVGAASEVRGSIDKEQIRRIVRSHIGEVKRCYDQGLTRRPDLDGNVVLKFTIGKTGTVVAATIQESTLADKQVEQCITQEASKWTFPKPEGDGIVTISYPFVFASAG